MIQRQGSNGPAKDKEPGYVAFRWCVRPCQPPEDPTDYLAWERAAAFYRVTRRHLIT